MQPAPSTRGRAWPSGDDTLFFSLLVIVFGLGLYAYLGWTFYHATISRAFAVLAHWHIAAIRGLTTDYDSLDRQLLTADYNRVTLHGIAAAATAIGRWYRIPAAALLGGLALLCFIRSPAARYTTHLDLDHLIAIQARFFRTIAAFGARRLRVRPLAAGEPRPADPALQPAEWLQRYAMDGGRISPALLRAALARQLGPVWTGPQQAVPHVRVLFAAFALHLAHRRTEALALLGDMAEALRPSGTEPDTGPDQPLTLRGAAVRQADMIIASPAGMEAARHAAGHGFTHPALMTLLTEARRRGGVLPPAAFGAVKLVDRRCWFALHSLGFPSEAHGRTYHPNPFVEAIGARDHWAVECDLTRPADRPSLDRAEAALRAFHAARAAPVPSPARQPPSQQWNATGGRAAQNSAAAANRPGGAAPSTPATSSTPGADT